MRSLAFMCSHSHAQDQIQKKSMINMGENDVVSLAGKKGSSFSTQSRWIFLFKPYALVQTSLSFNRYDDQGLESLYAPTGQNSGFAILMPSLDLQAKHLEKSHSTYH